MTSELPQLLTVRETADALRIEEKAARRLLRSRAIPGEVRVGRRVFVNAEVLAQYLRGEKAS